MGAGASTAIAADARRTEDQWLRELGRAVLDVQAAFDGRDDADQLTFAQVARPALRLGPRVLNR